MSDAERIAVDIVPVQVEDEMRSSYIDYAMSVIVSRALPDVRDGLKPVHRRILYAMSELNLSHNKPFKKSARIVGEVMGKYHPHGDAAIYDTLVRMAQDFSMRYPLVDGQGNYGSIDGDPPAAMRYTEARMKRLAEEMLADIEKDTVNFQPNFDDSLREPTVLPAKVPNLLVNGSDGIAVGMATKIPPHNLGEVVDALIHLIDNPSVGVDELLEFVKGPDFPTGGLIILSDEIKQAYRKGRGRCIVRGRVHVEEFKKDRERIIITEIPYQVNKAKLIEDIASLVRDKRIEGISDIRDESDRRGMRVVIELKRDVNSALVINQLYKYTQLQTTFGINMVALVDNRPMTLDLGRILREYLRHRRTVVTRRTQYELRKAEERLHILEGLKIALDNIDEVIALIKGSSSVDEAREGLQARFGLSQRQAQAILDMRLQKLTSLETRKILEELEEIRRKVEELKKILADVRLVMAIIKDELVEIKERYGDPRRTGFTHDTADFDARDLLDDETKVIMVTAGGYIKAIPLDTYRKQKRGGKGSKGLELKEEDVVDSVFVANTFDKMLFFTNFGRGFAVDVYRIPEGGRNSKGRPVVNLLRGLEKGEKVTAMLPIKEFSERFYLVMATKHGLVKRSRLSEYTSMVRSSGIKALRFHDSSDELVQVRLTDGSNTLLIGTKHGLAIHFPESDVRPQGRVSQGVKGIELESGDEVIGMEVISSQDNSLLVVTEKGYGKRSAISEYRLQHRGGKGIINIKVNIRNGMVAAFREVREKDEIILMTRGGKAIRMKAGTISKIGRNTLGVKIIDLSGDDRVTGFTVVRSDEEELSE